MVENVDLFLVGIVAHYLIRAIRAILFSSTPWIILVRFDAGKKQDY